MDLLRHAVSAARGSWRRSLAILLAVFAAVTAFVLLTGTAETQQLSAIRTVEENYRGSYDILVRPAGTASELERTDGLVRSAATGSPSGGISLDQLAAIRELPGVEVAAPLASVGFVSLTLFAEKEIGDGLATEGDRRLAWYTVTAKSRNGHLRQQVEEGYYYQTSQIMEDGEGLWDLSTGEPIMVCEPSAQQGSDDGWYPICNAVSGSTVMIGETPTVLEDVPTKIGVWMAYPLLIAAVDPHAEQQLSGLDEAVFEGRSLHAGDGMILTADGGTAVPALLASQQQVDLQLEVAVRQAPAEMIDDFLTADEAGRRHLLLDADLPVTLRTAADAENLFGQRVTSRGLGLLSTDDFQLQPHESLIRTGEASTVVQDGVVVPQPVEPASPTVWRVSSSGIDRFPPTVADTAYRSAERLYYAASEFSNVFTFDIVGKFDPARLSGGSSPGELPMDMFRAADVTAADAATEEVLGGRQLLSALNPTGYLQSAPALLISMEGLKFFTSGRYAELVDTPMISSVRVRAADITGMDEVSRERIRLVAERIAAATGLDVDIVIGSSTTRMGVTLPESLLGVPRLNPTEAWTKKGVAVSIVDALDAKSVALFLLILVSSAVTVAVVAQASVVARRRELGILAACGWPASRRIAAFLAEAALLGGVAGVLGAVAAWPLTLAFAVAFDPVRAASAIPTAMALTVLASASAAVRAGRLTPVAAMAPMVRRGRRRVLPVRGPVSLGVMAALQRPGRLLAGAATVALGVASLVVMLVLAYVFQGAVVGTLLGDAVAVQVRAPDLVAATLLAVLGLISVGVILFLGVTEDARDHACLLASGWRPRQVVRTVVTQSVVITATGAALGVGIAMAVMNLLVGAVPDGLWAWATATSAAVVLAGAAAALGTWGTLRRLPLAGLLSGE